MRSFILWVFLALSLLFATLTTEKIKDSRQDLKKAELEKKRASRQFEKIAEDIKKAKKEIDILADKLDILKEDKDKTEKLYHQLKEELKVSQKALEQTSVELKKKHEAFLKLATDQFSIIFAMQQFKTATQRSVISYEVYKEYKKYNSAELHSLKREINALQASQKNKRLKRDRTRISLKKIIKKRKDFAAKKRAKEKYVKNLEADEEKYQQLINKIVDKQNSLRDTLARLDILHKKEAEKARRAAEARKEAIRLEKERTRKLRIAKDKARKAKLALKKAKTKKDEKAARLAIKKAAEAEQKVSRQSEKVRRVHSSYKRPALYAYRGRKTISPIRGAKVIKKFGTYVDPVYKIKIYNESVTLKAPRLGAKVHNILNGKIVYAGTSSMLGKVVVVAHSGRLHTVYAGLSKIAPHIRKGRKIKKGYVVGKVSRKLVFQATKNSKHINPLRLIKI
ncbi:MAG: peptidoglycan DD-metalloendopeptidase family protein [Sulfurimonas sp.]